jgi:hypothetical protein
LSQVFFNSLQLTWIMGLLADAVVLLRAQALGQPVPAVDPLHELCPQQLHLEFEP